MIPPNNLEHAEAAAFMELVTKVVAKHYTGQARVQTSAMLGADESLVLAVRMAPVAPGKGPNLRMNVQMVVESGEPPESWKE